MSDFAQSTRLPADTAADLAKWGAIEESEGTAHPARSSDGTPLNFATLVSIFACAMAFTYAVYLGIMYHSHAWIIAEHGRPAVTDFLVFWLAGKSALYGTAASAYDPSAHHALEVAAAGHSFTGQLPWRYSPLFFFVVAPLAAIPYLPAFIAWVVASLAAFALTLSRIASSRAGLLLAVSTPAVFINAICGQNGPLTAMLIGAALLNLEVRPVASGIFLALLTYKPQFGVLFPLVLLAGGYWRVIIAAAIASGAALLASSLVFGFDTLPAFLHFLPITTNSLLVHGANGFAKLQTAYGTARWLGFGNSAAWLAQGIVIAAAAAAILWLWRRDLPYPVKAAALSTAILLATPHLFAYDFAILMVSFAFLYRQRPFDNLELIGIAAANFFIGLFLFVPTPVELISIVIAIAIIARRVRETALHSRSLHAACAA